MFFLLTFFFETGHQFWFYLLTQKFLRRFVGAGLCKVHLCLRVQFLLKTDSGYPKDTEVTLFTLATPGNFSGFPVQTSPTQNRALPHKRPEQNFKVFRGPSSISKFFKNMICGAPWREGPWHYSEHHRAHELDHSWPLFLTNLHCNTLQHTFESSFGVAPEDTCVHLVVWGGYDKWAP